MVDQQWFDNLKVGDRVIMHGVGISRITALATVEETNSKEIKTNLGRFSRKTRRLIGGGTWSSLNIAEDQSPEAIAKIWEQDEKRKYLRAIRSMTENTDKIVENVSLDNLKTVYGLLK